MATEPRRDRLGLAVAFALLLFLSIVAYKYHRLGVEGGHLITEQGASFRAECVRRLSSGGILDRAFGVLMAPEINVACTCASNEVQKIAREFIESVRLRGAFHEASAGMFFPDFSSEIERELRSLGADATIEKRVEGCRKRTFR